MIKHGIMFGLAMMTLSLMGASPSIDAEDMLRQAQAAQARGEWQRAIHLYEQAETTTTEPGFVAYNKAVALYRQALNETENKKRTKQLRAAERHFTYSLESAPQERAAQAWLGRGNSLLQIQDQRARTLKSAIDCYRKCLTVTKDESLINDARHNLELARLLWIKAGEKAPNEPENPDPDSNPDETQKKDDGREPNKDGDKEDKPPGHKKPGAHQPSKQKDGQTPQPIKDKPPPGQGSEKPLDDRASLPTLSPDDALKQLEEAAQKIRAERRVYRARAARQAMGTVKDW